MASEEGGIGSAPVDKPIANAPGDAPRGTSEVPIIKAGERAICTFVHAQAGVLLEVVLEEEVAEFLLRQRFLKDTLGRPAVVRNGLQPIRRIETNVGPVAVRIPKLRSRIEHSAVFRSSIVRPYLRRSRVTVPGAPLQFLRGLAKVDMHACLTALFGPEGTALPGHVALRAAQRWRSTCASALDGPLGNLGCDALWLASLDCAQFAPTTDKMMMAIGLDPTYDEKLFAMTEHERIGMETWRDMLCALRHRGMPRPGRIVVGERDAAVVTRALAWVFPGIHWQAAYTKNDVTPTGVR